MSLLENLLSSLTGKDSADFTPPCSLCPGSCPIAPEACALCRPYKEQLKDALYNVEHLDEFNARYEVVASVSTGTTVCPYCGGPSASRFVCDYCGMQLAEDDGKIRVTSANDIPDPILEARDLIYERHSKVVAKYSESESSGGLLSGLLSLLSGESAETGLGDRMNSEEIQEAAALYGVSVSTYLNGLDNGTYRTLSEKKKADAAQTVTGLGGAAVFGGTTGHSVHQTPPRPGHPPMPPQPSRPDHIQSRPGSFGHTQNRPGQSGQMQRPGRTGAVQKPGRGSTGHGPQNGGPGRKR